VINVWLIVAAVSFVGLVICGLLAIYVIGLIGDMTDREK